MKKLITILLFWCPAVLWAFTVDNISYELTSASTVKVASRQTATLTGDLVIPATVAYDGKDYQVTAVDNNAFYGQQGLTSVVLPAAVRSIGSSAFYGCTALTSVQLPEAISSLATNVFYGCTALEQVRCMAMTPPQADGELFHKTALYFGTLTVPAASVNTYRHAYGWRGFSHIVGEGDGEYCGVSIYYADTYSFDETIQVNGQPYSPVWTQEGRGYFLDVEKGSDVLIDFKTADQSEMDITANGRDVSEYADGGSYTIRQIQEDVTITASRHSVPYVLWLQQADGGCIGWAPATGGIGNYQLQLIPAEGYTPTLLMGYGDDKADNLYDVTYQLDGELKVNIGYLYNNTKYKIVWKPSEE